MSPQVSPSSHPGPSPSRAFTLVELLVVIGIIAVLISILMPTLSRARRQAHEVVCQSNLRQVAMAMLTYSLAHKGTLPGTSQGIRELDWCGTNSPLYNPNAVPFKHPLPLSPLARFLKTDKVLTCPTGERPNGLYDYTMIMRLGGMKSNCRWKISYPVNPGALVTTRKYFDGMPLLVEEHEKFYNVQVKDGSFGSNDQFTTRHNGRSNIAYADGSVGGFLSPHGKVDTAEDLNDLRCYHLVLHANGRNFTVSGTTPTEFGWANQPK